MLLTVEPLCFILFWMILRSCSLFTVDKEAGEMRGKHAGTNNRIQHKRKQEDKTNAGKRLSAKNTETQTKADDPTKNKDTR